MKNTYKILMLKGMLLLSASGMYASLPGTRKEIYKTINQINKEFATQEAISALRGLKKEAEWANFLNQKLQDLKGALEKAKSGGPTFTIMIYKKILPLQKIIAFHLSKHKKLADIAEGKKTIEETKAVLGEVFKGKKLDGKVDEDQLKKEVEQELPVLKKLEITIIPDAYKVDEAEQAEFEELQEELEQD